jgi:hypothetical protein
MSNRLRKHREGLKERSQVKADVLSERLLQLFVRQELSRRTFNGIVILDVVSQFDSR